MSVLTQNFRAVVVGASGGIGREVVRQLSQNKNAQKIYALSRAGHAHTGTTFEAGNVQSLNADMTNEESLAKAATKVAEEGAVDLVFVATGLLHGEDISPEKAFKDINMAQMEEVFRVNTFGPALVAKHFCGVLNREKPSVFTAISARVGSISDNHLGGWYSYRGSKAALNMFLRGISIEVARRNKNAVILGLHPGTVETGLSEPFQANVPEGQLFSPEYSVRCMLDVVDAAQGGHSGKVFDYAGKEVPA